MPYEGLMALIEDGGGFQNVVRLVFDNNIHVSFTRKPQESDLKKEDFVELGGTWYYKEIFLGRSNTDYDYNVPLTNYHPLDCLQSVIMSSQKDKLDIFSINDMVAQNSATG